MTEKKIEPDEELKKKVTRILRRIKGIFASKREISRIYVSRGTQRMWVSNPKKIKFWMNMAQHSARASLDRNILPSIRILKVIYKNGTGQRSKA